MSLPNYLAKIKSAGIYRFVWDKSIVSPTAAETLRLVVGYSEKGPFNTPVYIEKVSDFYSIFGNISKKLERKGIYFHRLAIQALAAGPILALNLKPFTAEGDDAEKIDWVNFDPAESLRTLDIHQEAIANIYDTNRFWHLDADQLPSKLSSQLASQKYITIAHTDTADRSCSIIMRPANPSDYNVTIRDWYATVSSEEMPAYLEPIQDELVSKYFMDVYIFRGKFTHDLVKEGGPLGNYITEYNDEGAPIGQKWNGYFEAVGNDTTSIELIYECDGEKIKEKFNRSASQDKVFTFNNATAYAYKSEYSDFCIYTDTKSHVNYYWTDVTKETPSGKVNNTINAVAVTVNNGPAKSDSPYIKLQGSGIAINNSNVVAANGSQVHTLYPYINIATGKVIYTDNWFGGLYTTKLNPTMKDWYGMNDDMSHEVPALYYTLYDSALYIQNVDSANAPKHAYYWRENGDKCLYESRVLNNTQYLANRYTNVQEEHTDKMIIGKFQYDTNSTENSVLYVAYKFAQYTSGYEGAIDTIRNIKVGDMTCEDVIDHLANWEDYEQSTDRVVPNDVKSWTRDEHNFVAVYDMSNNYTGSNREIWSSTVGHFENVAAADITGMVVVNDNGYAYKFESYIDEWFAQQSIWMNDPDNNITPISKGDKLNFTVKLDYGNIGSNDLKQIRLRLTNNSANANLGTFTDCYVEEGGFTPIYNSDKTYIYIDVEPNKYPQTIVVSATALDGVDYTKTTLNVMGIYNNPVVADPSNDGTQFASRHMHEVLSFKMINSRSNYPTYTIGGKTCAKFVCIGENTYDPDNNSRVQGYTNYGDVIYAEISKDKLTGNISYTKYVTSNGWVNGASAHTRLLKAQLVDSKKYIRYNIDTVNVKSNSVNANNAAISTIYPWYDAENKASIYTAIDGFGQYYVGTPTDNTTITVNDWKNTCTLLPSKILELTDNFVAKDFWINTEFKNAYDEKIDALDYLASDSASNFIQSYRGCLMPYFKDGFGNYVSLDVQFNLGHDLHNMLMKFDEDILYDIVSELGTSKDVKKDKLEQILYCNEVYKTTRLYQDIEGVPMDELDNYGETLDYIPDADDEEAPAMCVVGHIPYQLITKEPGNTKLRPTYLGGYTYSTIKNSDTDIILQNKILKVLDDKGIRTALTNRVDVDYHYIVDTFQSYVTAGCKGKFAMLAKEKDNAFAILNFPPMPSFINSGLFNSKNKFDISKIANARYGFSLPSENEGASHCGFFTGLNFSDGTLKYTVPSAAIVSNNFMKKYDGNLKPYHIIAGPNRGLVSYSGMVGPDYNYGRSDLDVLEPLGVNAIIYVPRKGTYINSNQTAKQTPVSALSKIHIRELVTYIQNEIENMLQNYQWELNTQSLRDTVKTNADYLLGKIMADGGIYAYSTICDSTNNTPDIIDNEMLVLDIAIEPARGAGKMVQQLTIHKTGGITSTAN